MVNRIVLHRQRAMAAGVGHLEVKILIDLLARLHLVGEVLAFAQVAAAAFVDRELGVEQVLVVLDQPLGAVELAAFLVGGQHQNQIAVRCYPLLLQADQVGDELRCHRLVVAGAAAVEEAVLLDEGERIHRPVLALGFDDVEVGEEEERPVRAGAAEAEDQVALARIRSDDLHVRGREARRLEPRRHRFRRLRHVAGRRVGGVDLDQLFVNLPRPRIVRPRLRRDQRRRDKHQHGCILHARDYIDILRVMKFAPEYVTYVLNENFEDAKALLLSPMMAINYAHLVMLAEQRIVSAQDAHTLRAALDSVSQDAIRQVSYDGTYEDLFFYVERLVGEACGDADVAGRLHTARSRNDMDMTMYRIYQRELVLGLLAGTFELRRSLLDLIDRHRDTVLVLHTHTQRAQPSTVAHYLLAVVEQLERDGVRLQAAFASTNWNPLGACAITGTGFPIDRSLTSALLGFSGPTGNTYGSIATVDYLLESTSAATVLLTGHGRFVQDMLLWSTAEFGYLRLGDGYVQGSSIMPQKRNPVALEHARAIGSKALGQAQAIVLTAHNTPFGDIVDTEDDLQPLVFAMFRDATRAVQLVGAAMSSAQFDAPALEARAGDGWTTLTELADTLVRDDGLPFRTAHAIAQRLIAARQAEPQRPLVELLAAASTELVGRPLKYSDAELARVLS